MTEHYREKGKVKSLMINGFPPTDNDALITHKYPFYRTYNLTTWAGKNVENIKAQGLLDYIVRESPHLNPGLGFVPAASLKKAGWIFREDELVGEQ